VPLGTRELRGSRLGRSLRQSGHGSSPTGKAPIVLSPPDLDNTGVEGVVPEKVSFVGRKGQQLDALKKAGCKRVFTDKLSGAQTDRPGLKEALSHLREADTLVVWKLDRLGRSVKGLVDLVNEMQSQCVHFKSLTDGIDTKTSAGRSSFT
jgi:hypothetical protein